MLEITLVGSAALMGLAGSPHCALMCGGPCAATCGQSRRAQTQFLAGRALSYAVAGAVAAAAVQALGWMTQGRAVMQPVWALAHAALLMLGLSLIWLGRQPIWLDGIGAGWLRRSSRAPGLAGLAWVAWPCGLLQSALLVAGLTSSPLGGGLAMLVFALASSPGLVAAPWVLRRLKLSPAWSARLAGLGLALASGWALGHGVWETVRLYC
ncbi:sulfite exporter TauE/SafE family protein [Roseateles sp.]|uniref:sulfite exporter TauE/SafE family protein n=1 Tax=Roseateles sp. TaxID=1971397 RepID=UPI00393AC186